MRSFLNNQSIDWTAGKSISAAPALCGTVGCIRLVCLEATLSNATKFCRLCSPLKPSEEGAFVKYAVIYITNQIEKLILSIHNDYSRICLFIYLIRWRRYFFLYFF